MCLYSSQCECLFGNTVLQSYKGSEVHCEFPHINYQYYSLQPPHFHRLSAWTNTHEPENEGLIALIASQEELSWTGTE